MQYIHISINLSLFSFKSYIEDDTLKTLFTNTTYNAAVARNKSDFSRIKISETNGFAFPPYFWRNNS